MKLRLHIDALAIEADWPRAGRADFVAALRSALGAELVARARSDGFAARRAERPPAFNLSAAALATPAAAGAHIARAIVAAVAPRPAPAGAPRAAGRRSP